MPVGSYKKHPGSYIGNVESFNDIGKQLGYIFQIYGTI